ncbi:MAG: ABC transporter substrate-binding protein, partial [Pyrinomonadaceae bacterium]|nr:ABC transporter substrate-binding protein [Pyrinomonadaceae bacterium]
MTKTESRKNGSFKYVLIIVALIAAVIFGVELSRRNSFDKNSNNTNVSNAANASQPFPRELRDGDNQVFVVQTKPNRIVSQTLGTDEILLTICEPERVVALSNLAEDANYSNIVEKAREIPNRVTQGAEQILQLSPDLIFVANYSRAEVVELLKASKAPVFRFTNFTSIEDIKNNIRTVGFATGCDAGAETLLQKFNDDLAAIKLKIPANQKPPRVMSFGGGYTAGSKTTFNDIVRSAGAVNVSAEKGIDGFGKISA